MKRVKFTAEHIIALLAEYGVRAKCTDLCRKYDMPGRFFYKLKAKLNRPENCGDCLV